MPSGSKLTSADPKFTLGIEDNDALLTYRVGPVLCCGPTLPVITITIPPPLTHLPGTSSAEPGIFKHDSYIVRATDLRYRFGVQQQRWKQPGQVIVAQHDNTTRGYFVDEIKDVIHFPESGWGSLPSHLPRGVFSRTLLLNNVIYLYAEFNKLSTLEGSGYLSEYIEQLEKNKHQELDKLKSATVKTTSSFNKQDQNTTNSTIETSTTKSKSSLDSDPIYKNLSKDQNRNQSSNQTKYKKSSKNPDIKITETIQPGSSATNSKVSQDKKLAANTQMDSNVSSSLSQTEKENSNLSNTPLKPTTKTKSTTISAKKSYNKHTSNTKQKTTTRLTTKVSAESIRNKGRTNSSATNSQSSISNSLHSDNKEELDSRNNKNPDKYKIQSKLKNQNKDQNQNSNSQYTDSIKQDNDQPQTDSSSYALLIFIFILLIVAAGLVYYFMQSNTTRFNEKTSNNKNLTPQQQSLATYDTEDSIRIESDTTTIDTVINRPAEITDIKTVDLANASDISEADINPSSLNAKNSEYHATIQEDSDTITIELNGPLPPKIKNNSSEKNNTLSVQATQVTIDTAINESEIAKQPDNVDNGSITTQDLPDTQKTASPVINQSDKKKLTPEGQAKDNSFLQKTPSSIEIIHIIVKGDTLWAIAKHYLQNPFLYPELAKLSKIENPDLIYPGNRVRIIYKKH